MAHSHTSTFCLELIEKSQTNGENLFTSETPLMAVCSNARWLTLPGTGGTSGRRNCRTWPRPMELGKRCSWKTSDEWTKEGESSKACCPRNVSSAGVRWYASRWKGPSPWFGHVIEIATILNRRIYYDVVVTSSVFRKRRRNLTILK